MLSFEAFAELVRARRTRTVLANAFGALLVRVPVVESPQIQCRPDNQPRFNWSPQHQLIRSIVVARRVLRQVFAIGVFLSVWR